jgi:two-component system sensor histidine kinase UhpB
METPFQTITVLLIDPNKDDRQHWMEQLQRASTHYRMIEAQDAEAGVAIWKMERVDCVVLELHLPDMSGFQVLIRMNPIVNRRLQTPVVALSHFVLPSIAEAAKKLGAQSYLIKSQTSGEDLDRAIKNAITTVGPTVKNFSHTAA